MRLLTVIAAVACSVAAAAPPTAIFDEPRRQWKLENGLVEFIFQLTPGSRFLIRSMRHLNNGDTWLAVDDHPASPVRLKVDDQWFDYNTPVELVSQHTEKIQRGSGLRQVIVLRDLAITGQVRVELELYPNQPVLRYDVRYTNLNSRPAYVQWVNVTPWAFGDQGRKYTAFRVDQWIVGQKDEDFNTLQTTLDRSGVPVEVFSGAAGQQCSWLVLRDDKQRGIFLGWEFDGRARTTVRHYGADGYLQFASNILDLNHEVASLQEFAVPAAFIGLYHGDWDEAGYRTRDSWTKRSPNRLRTRPFLM